MQVLNMIFYTGITLGVLVFIHEFGHFLAAKLTGMRADIFSIGFGYRLFGFSRKDGFSAGSLPAGWDSEGHTDYRVSLLPLGGYVKIAGMIDESFDTEFLKREPNPWEFRARPMWARMIVISAGVIMNILLAIVIFWGINFTNGRVIKETTEVGSVLDGSSADSAGFHSGDKILSINGKAVADWDAIETLVYVENLGNAMTFDVERTGKRISLVSTQQNAHDLATKPFGLVEAHTLPSIRAVEPGMPAEKLGIRPGDVITAIDDVPVGYPQVITSIKKHAGGIVCVTWKRGDAQLSGTSAVTPEGRIGISIEGIYTGPLRHIRYSLIEAFPQGLKKTWESVYLFYLTISKIINGQASVKESFGGPIAIAQLATQSAELGLSTFLGFMALLSMSLAIINIFPFPALDGGHLIMLVYEKIFPHEIPHRVKLALQQAGFILLLAFMAFVIYNDFSRF